jgi:hypothetical protein
MTYSTGYIVTNQNSDISITIGEFKKLLESLNIYKFALKNQPNFMIDVPVTYEDEANLNRFRAKVNNKYIDCPVPMVLINPNNKPLLCPFSLINFVILCELCGLTVKEIGLSQHDTEDGTIQKISLLFQKFKSFVDTIIPLHLIKKIKELYTVKGIHVDIADCFKFSCSLDRDLPLSIEYADLDYGITDLIQNFRTFLKVFYAIDDSLITFDQLMLLSKIKYQIP